MSSDTDQLCTLVVGQSPLIINVPHAGTALPPGIAHQLTETGLAMPDTDWHVDKLYAFARETGATLLVAHYSRIVVDLNRPPSGEKLYPGQAETGICPTESFAGEPYYRMAPPDAAEVERRVATYWKPYHDTLRHLIEHTRSRHGFVHVLDGHSIHGRIPRLFPGLLPDLNLGTFDGASCAPALAARVMATLEGHRFSTVLNGRFKGGHITRHYGAPSDGVHVLQLELAWRAYLDEARPRHFEPSQAGPLIAVLRRVVDALSRA